MAKQTTVVAFAGQKGGTGKTTIATAFASFLHYVQGRNVLIIDADSPQYSLWTHRNRELENLRNDDSMAARFEKQGVPIYPIINKQLKDVPSELKKHRQSGEFDVIVIDTPGTVNVAGYNECLMAVDYVVTPLEAEELSLTSNLEFIGFIINDLVGVEGSLLKDYFVFWNKIRKNTNKDFFIQVHTELLESGINVLDPLVEDRVDYQRSVCRSTLFPISLTHRDSGLANLINLVSDKISIN